MIKDQMKKDMFAAMKAKDEVALSTLKLALSSLTNAEIAKKREALSKQEEVDVIKKEVKKRKDAIELYKKAGAKEKIEREESELKLLTKYLPEQESTQVIEKTVAEVIKVTNAKDLSDMGRVIGMVMGRLKNADGAEVAEIAKKMLL